MPPISDQRIVKSLFASTEWPFCVAGLSSEPEVSVPIAAAHRPAATATAEPELDPPGGTIGTSLSSSCGA